MEEEDIGDDRVPKKKFVKKTKVKKTKSAKTDAEENAAKDSIEEATKRSETVSAIEESETMHVDSEKDKAPNDKGDDETNDAKIVVEDVDKMELEEDKALEKVSDDKTDVVLDTNVESFLKVAGFRKEQVTASPESLRRTTMSVTTVFLNTPSQSTLALGEVTEIESTEVMNVDQEDNKVVKEEKKTDEKEENKEEKKPEQPIISAVKKLMEMPMNIIKRVKKKSVSEAQVEVGTESPPLPPRNKTEKQGWFSSLQHRRREGRDGKRESSLPPAKRDTSPQVPPKTYMWEDVKRSKAKGGYPWTHLYKGSLDEAQWNQVMEHEYEYVDPRSELSRADAAPEVTVDETALEEKPAAKRRFIRTEESDRVIIPLHGSSDEEHNPDRYEDPELIGHEEIGLTPKAFRPSRSPSPLPPTIAAAEPRLARKIKSTAEQLGSKMRKISIPDKSKLRLPDKPKFLTEMPQIKMPETPKFLTEKPKFLTEKPKFLTEKPKFLTEKPKFLTEKPKFLTEKPKFLTEKPKFLTEKPKFLTEKPKFLTEKPKFLTEKPKFLTEKPKFLTEKPKFLTEKPKFLTEKPKFLTEKPKFLKEGIKFPDRPNITFPTFTLPKKKKTSKRVTSVTTEYGSDKNIFRTLKTRVSNTYPRFLNKRKKHGTKKSTPPPGKAGFDSESLPSTPRSKRNDRWTRVYKEKKVDPEKVSYSNGESFRERYAKRDGKRASSSSVADSDREQASSGSSTRRHRAGVIEEIDSDEFFVRAKGISREDVQVSSYLTSEIREAFRSPDNALASLDGDPRPPRRKRTPKEYPTREYGTFPLRPSRASKRKPPRRFRSQGSAPGSIHSLPDQACPEPPPRRGNSGSRDRVPSNSLPPPQRQVGAGESQEKMEWDEEAPVAPTRKTRSRGTSLADEDRTSRGAESIRSEMQVDDELIDDTLRTEERDIEIERVTLVTASSDFSNRGVLPQSTEPAYSNVNKSRPPRPPPPAKDERPPTHQRLKSKIMSHRHMQQLQNWKNRGVNFFFTYPRKAFRNGDRVPKRPARNYSTLGGPTRPPRRHKVFREPVYVDAEIDAGDAIPYIDDEDKMKSSKSEETVGGMKGRPLPPTPSKADARELSKSERLDLIDKIDREIIDSIKIERSDETLSRREDSTDGMRSRPLPPPPRRKRGSTSTDRKSSAGADALNDLDREEEEDVEAVDARMIIDIIDPVTVLSVQQIEPVKKEERNKEQDTQAPPRKITAEISQQTSLDVAEITVSVQTDPLPEGVIVENNEEVSLKSKQPESDEEPTIEKYLEKYGTEIKMLGRQAAPTKVEAAKPETQAIAEERLREIEERVKRVEEEIVPLKAAESAESEAKKEPVAPVPIQFPESLHLTNLDVDNLNVSSLKASQIIVSDLTGENLQVAEITSKGGNLVVSGLELPPSFVQSLASEISTKIEEKLPVVEKPCPPSPSPQRITAVTAPPAVVVQTALGSIDVSSAQTAILSSSDNIPPPRTTRNRGKKGLESQRIVDDSEDELATNIQLRSSSESRISPEPSPSESKSDTESKPVPKEEPIQKKETPVIQEKPKASTTKVESKPSGSSSTKDTPSTSKTPLTQPIITTTSASGLTARQLLTELLVIWKNCLQEGFTSCSNTLGAAFPEGRKRIDAQRAACILLVIIIGLFALGFGTDNTVHHHHWDFIPPRM